jgi:hypothetical protein
MKNPLQFNFMCRFHLGKDKDDSGHSHFMHWRIEKMSCEIKGFTNPNNYGFIFHNAFLRNRKGAANKIHNGASKTVCAWIEAEAVELIFLEDIIHSGVQVSYNPRKAPNWLLNGKNADGMTFPKLVTDGNRVFTPINQLDELFSTYEKTWLAKLDKEVDALEDAEYQKYY